MRRLWIAAVLAMGLLVVASGAGTRAMQVPEHADDGR
jgi:hypothetical protein